MIKFPFTKSFGFFEFPFNGKLCFSRSEFFEQHSLFWLKLFFLKPPETTLKIACKRKNILKTHMKVKVLSHSVHYWSLFLVLEKVVLASTASICKRHLEHLPPPPFLFWGKLNCFLGNLKFLYSFFSIGPKWRSHYYLGPLRTLALFPLRLCSETSDSGLVVNLKGANWFDRYIVLIISHESF